MHKAKAIFKDYKNDTEICFDRLKPDNAEFHNTVSVQLCDAKTGKLEKESIT